MQEVILLAHEKLSFIALAHSYEGGNLIMRDAGTVIVSLVSSSITSFRRITT